MRVWDNEPEDSFDEINIIPMIDVIFAILTFFILSTLFLTRAEELPVDLPSAETSEQKPQPDFIVTIDAEGEVSLDKEAIEVDNLDTEITDQLESGEEAIVTIQADERAYHGQVIEVMDILRTIEGVRLGIGTLPKTD
ncbi:MAG: biopolymer transporter ExbD [Cyanobacteria bacterium P01_G01_bin.54]